MVRANLGMYYHHYLLMDWTKQEQPELLISPPMSTLPGQQILLPVRSPALQLGPGVYQRDGYIRASLLGTPLVEGSVRPLRRFP